MKQKEYLVNIDMMWSESYPIKANGVKDAKEKAWMKFQKQLPKKNFKIYVDAI